MEIIRKKIKIVKIATIIDGNINIVSNDNVTYNFKILLKSDVKDLGYFNVSGELNT